MNNRSGIVMTAIGVMAFLFTAYVAQGESAVAALPQAIQAPAAFAQCRACHSVDKGGRSGIGPNLFGVSGAPAGAKPGYSYSPAMKASRIRWDTAKLDAYLANPKGLVPGTKMLSPPVKDAVKRKEIIDYLAKLK